MSLQKHQVLSIAHDAGHMQRSSYMIVTACELHCMGLLWVLGILNVMVSICESEVHSAYIRYALTDPCFLI